MLSSPGRHQGHARPRITLSEVDECRSEQSAIRASDFDDVRGARMTRGNFCYVFGDTKKRKLCFGYRSAATA